MIIMSYFTSMYTTFYKNLYLYFDQFWFYFLRMCQVPVSFLFFHLTSHMSCFLTLF